MSNSYDSDQREESWNYDHLAGSVLAESPTGLLPYAPALPRLRALAGASRMHPLAAPEGAGDASSVLAGRARES